MASPRTGEQAARARAALAYADKKQPEVAQALDMSVTTWARVEGGRRALSPAEAEKLAELTGVPVGFLRNGFGPKDATLGELGERIGAMELHFRGATERLREERAAIYREFLARTERIEELVAQNNALLEQVIRSPGLDPGVALEKELADAAEQARTQSGSSGSDERAQDA